MTRQRFEKLAQVSSLEHEEVQARQSQYFEQNVSEQNELIRHLNEDLKFNELKFEEVLAQQEHEYEREIAQLKVEQQRQLAVERQVTAEKEGQFTALRNQYDTLKKKFQEVKSASYARDVTLETELEKNVKLEQTLAHFERHIEQREKSLSDKENNLIQLRERNRTLDNFRYVLDHHVEALVEQQRPTSEHVRHLEQVIKDMREELMVEFGRKATIEQEMRNKDLKVGFSEYCV